MTHPLDPAFLDRPLVDLLHRQALFEHGGLHGVRDSFAIDSAIGRVVLVNDYIIGCDLFDLAGAYAHGLAQAQGYIDGNKRTGIAAAYIFLESNGIDTARFDEDELHAAMIQSAERRTGRERVSEILRQNATR